MGKSRRIAIGGWYAGSLSIMTRGWFPTVLAPTPAPSAGGGGGGYFERRTLIPMPAPLPRMRRRYGWVDIEDEEILLIIDDLEIV